MRLKQQLITLLCSICMCGACDSSNSGNESSTADTGSDSDSIEFGETDEVPDDGSDELSSDTPSDTDSEKTVQETSEFELLWRDDFDSFDSSKWQLMTHSWDGNLAQFSTTNTRTEDGLLYLDLTEEQSDTEKPFRGVEMRSRDTLTYGKIEASVKFAAGSGVISSLVAIYTPWPPDDWNEIDIEFLGQNDDRIQFNHMINIPPADPISGHLQFPEMSMLDFNPSADFHTYTIEWVPDAVRFSVDGVLLYTAVDEVERLVLPQNILLTIWATDAAAWAGAINDSTAPTSAVYDWVELYTYRGE